MSTCNASTLLAQAIDFQRLSPRDLEIVLAQLLCNISNSGGAGIFNTAHDAAATIITPSTGVTVAGAIAKNLFTSPASPGAQAFPYVFQLSVNQSFVIQDDTGNNLFGIRADDYALGSGHWEINFGSKNKGLIDQLFDIGTGGQIGWRKNGDLSNVLAFSGSNPIGLSFTFVNPNYAADTGGALPLFDNYGGIYPVLLRGYSIHAAQTVVLGAAAGTGGSVGVTMDADASDISVAITLVTGNAGLGAGILFTFNLENAVSPFDSSVVALPVKPVFSAANSAAAGVAVYTQSTGALITLRCNAALTANTTYVWNFFNCR